MNSTSLHYRLKVALLCTLGQVMSIDIIITSKSIFHELFIITAVSKVRFTPVITYFTKYNWLSNEQFVYDPIINKSLSG